MRTKILQVLIVLALVCVIGGHWAILQSVAWAGMVVNYCQRFPLREALVKTFDGKNPCKLCKVVQQGQSAEKRPDVKQVQTKLDFFLDSKQIIILSEPHLPCHTANLSLVTTRAESPPKPPPRTA